MLQAFWGTAVSCGAAAVCGTAATCSIAAKKATTTTAEDAGTAAAAQPGDAVWLSVPSQLYIKPN